MESKATGISPNKPKTKKKVSVKKVTKKKSSIKSSTKKQASTRRKRKNVQISSAEPNTLTQQTEQLTWTDAIAKVFNDEKRPLHYTEIALLIEERQYRTDLGVTPSNSVNAEINRNISKYYRIERGTYIPKSLFNKTQDYENRELAKTTDLVYAMGFYWSRHEVDWKDFPDLFGQVGKKTDLVNFKDQIGIYLLHDGREIVYIGKAIEQPIGQRLYKHTVDRLAGRWDRFSWFGFLKVNDDGTISKLEGEKYIDIKEFGNLLEGLLIECIEPRSNRKKGDKFNVPEFLQYIDHGLEAERGLNKLLLKTDRALNKLLTQSDKLSYNP